MAEKTSHYVLELDLIGPWFPVDLDSPLGPEVSPPLLSRLREAGLLPGERPQGIRVVLSGVMYDEPREAPEVHPPLLATLTVLETDLEVPARPTAREDGAVEVTERTWRTTVDWPEGVGPVEFHHVRYAVPSPDGASLFSMEFTTPNLPMVAEMEMIFSVIAGSAAFREVLPVEA
jgi:hypothetical protein